MVVVIVVLTLRLALGRLESQSLWLRLKGLG